MSLFTPALDFSLNLEKAYEHAGIRDAETFLNEALDFTLPQEGGEVNDPDDPGGHTNHGVTQGTYDRWQRAKGIKTPRTVSLITMGEVCLIYDELYWDAGRCETMAPCVAVAHFDACVNFGVTGALQILQRALGVTDDGLWGQVTEHVLAAETPLVLLDNMCWERLSTYLQKVRAKPVKNKFLRNWTTRTVALRRYARTLHEEQN